MAVNADLIQSQFDSQEAYLILEQFAQRFYQFEFHLLQQSTHIVVSFNRGGGSLEGNGFNYIGVQGPLEQKFRIIQFLRFPLKDFNEGVPDNFALLFRVSDIFQFSRNRSLASMGGLIPN